MLLIKLGLLTIFCGVIFTVAVCLTIWVIMGIIGKIEDWVERKK